MAASGQLRAESARAAARVEHPGPRSEQRVHEPRLAVQVDPLRRQIGEAPHVVVRVGLAALVLPPCHNGHGSDLPRMLA